MLKKIAEGLAAFFAVALLLFTGWRTYNLLAMTAPGSIIMPALGLVVFDVGFVCWTVLFLHKAEGIPQRTVTIIGAIADLLLVVAAVIADIFLDGQTLAAVPHWVGFAALIVVGVAVAINVGLVFLYHVTDPRAITTIRERARQDKIDDALRTEEDETVDLALKMFREQRRAVAAQLAEATTERMMQTLHERMGTTRHALPAPATANVPRLTTSAEKITPLPEPLTEALLEMLTVSGNGNGHSLPQK